MNVHDERLADIARILAAIERVLADGRPRGKSDVFRSVTHELGGIIAFSSFETAGKKLGVVVEGSNGRRAGTWRLPKVAVQ